MEELLVDEAKEEPPNCCPPVGKGDDFDRHRAEIHHACRSRAFCARFFPEASSRDWDNWRWQLRNRITTPERLAEILALSADETFALTSQGRSFPLSITPYYASLLDSADPSQPLRRSVVPVTAENIRHPGESDDPLREDGHSPLPGLVHRYPDRVLFLATDFCSTYCRYCTRSRLVGRCRRQGFTPEIWRDAIDYIRDHQEIRDVLVSGGDPLTLPESRLDWLLGRLRAIPHVEVIRIGSKVPMVLPQRVTPALLRMLRRHHPLWISIHCTHPDELTPEAVSACGRLADAGIPLGSQTVLLAGINDDAGVMRRLVQGLMRCRVRPYYLYQCDPITGSAHFRTPVRRGLEIYQALRGHTSGYAVPTYVIDAPGGGGKIPLLPETVLGADGSDLLLKNFENRVFRYPDLDGAEWRTKQVGTAA